MNSRVSLTRHTALVDKEGWAQAEGPARRYGVRRARWGLPWTLAEDRALLQRVRDAISISWTDPTIRATAVAHGRGACAIATRVRALRSGMRFAATAEDS